MWEHRSDPGAGVLDVSPGWTIPAVRDGLWPGTSPRWDRQGWAAGSLRQRTWVMPEVNPPQQGLGEPPMACPQMPFCGRLSLC